MLGLIAYAEKKIGTALKSWRELVRKYPETKEAKSVADRVEELAEVVGGVEKGPIKNKETKYDRKLKRKVFDERLMN